MTILRIHVQDKIKVFDKTGDAVTYIEEVLRQFNDDTNSIKITIEVDKSNPTRAPPTLGVHVSDKVDTKEALG